MINNAYHWIDISLISQPDNKIEDNKDGGNNLMYKVIPLHSSEQGKLGKHE